MLSSILRASLAYSVAVSAIGTHVIKTNEGPTGYEVQFVFTPNATEHYDSVLLGGFPLYSDPLGSTQYRTMAISPWDWRPDDFGMELIFGDANPKTYQGFNMTYNDNSGNWTVTVPFPSGTFRYAFYPDCDGPYLTDLNCTPIVDPSNPPIQRLPGDQLYSNVQVPFDGRFQKNDYDWQLPLPNVADRGKISFHLYPMVDYDNYMSPISLYLPAEYGTIPNKTYPVLYLQHGGGGTDSDWFSEARAHHIFDRLINQGVIEPTIIVCPNFYDMPFKYAGLDQASLDTFFNTVLDVYLSSLLPYIESNFAVTPTPSHRAFAGLSLGGGMTLAMLFNATSHFSSFGPWSHTPSPPLGDPQWNASTLHRPGIFLGAGFYDVAFQNVRDMQQRLDAVGIWNFRSQFPMNGAHQWSSWQVVLEYYARYGLWKPNPWTIRPKQGPFDLSGEVPY